MHLIRLVTSWRHAVPLELRLDQPHDSYDMDEWGKVIVGPAPADFLMSRFLGRPVRAVHRIIDRHPDGGRYPAGVRSRRGTHTQPGRRPVITDAALPEALEAELVESSGDRSPE
ncbi:hypothetical protein GCM10027203_68420 [Nonomuraea fastidiosa]|jgi:hypothetical protein